jgi:hypothetical protein
MALSADDQGTDRASPAVAGQPGQLDRVVPGDADTAQPLASPGPREDPGPFGGTGKSGYGREMGFAAMAEYTTQESVWINVDAALPDWYA